MPEKTKKFPHSADSTGAEYPIPALIGIIGGFIAVVIPLWIGIVSTSTIRTVMLHELFAKFSYIGIIPQLQVFLILLIGATFLGFIIPCIHHRYIQKMADAIRAGIVSGVCTGVVTTSFLVLMPVLFHDYFDVNQYLLLIISAALLSLIFETTGAIAGYLWYSRRASLASSVSSLPHSIAVPGIVAIVLVILTFVLPMTVPTVSWDKCQGFIDDYNVERLDEDTIRITQLTENSPSDCLLDKPFVHKIYLDDKEVSNQTVIHAQGLQDSITPPEGLIYTSGSQIVLKGAAISNTTHRPKLRIEKYTTANDGSLKLMHRFFTLNI